ncbi:Uma2 family endonuclease [Bradyrhizobium sp. CB1015]|uniref:Uma2 family endonuclease n=1 Tax=Bradyrhizobium sp. CB1015 TaxID=2976822 RepID=UPI0021AAB130|nr:Uma2 family endonuclease [Bradyrhizobium sp. CB1015]UWU94814.1 Uma2 family endonuclease [Bradyrhizobium sp. CB1015]
MGAGIKEPSKDPAKAGRMSGERFRAFQEGRPDHERRELIAGVPMMMTPSFSTTLWRSTTMAASQCSVPASSSGRANFRPEPDVAVIDADYEPGQRFVDRAYLLAEIVSSTDGTRVPDTDAKWIDVKRTIYLAHAACEAVLIIEQDRMEVRLDTRTSAGWSSQRWVRPTN